MTIIKNLQIILLSVGLCGIFSCNGQQDNGKTFNQTYNVGSIPEIEDFETLNEQEKLHDSIANQYNQLIDSMYLEDTIHMEHDLLDKMDFRNNRSRIFMNFYTNEKLSVADSSFVTGFPTQCQCLTDKDTLFISMGIGFFGGLGFNLKLVNHNFYGSFYEYTDDVKPYKSDLNDTAFYDHVEVQNKYQSLILSEKPTFQSGQQLTGYMTFTSKYFYEKKYGNQLDTNFVTGKLYFTCKTRQKLKWE